jgi:hypothetical protein
MYLYLLQSIFMKKSLLPVIGLFIIAAFYMLISANKFSVLKSAEGSVGRGASGDDDVNGRAQYELMRLRDPATGQIPFDIRNKELAFAAGLPNDFGMTRSASLSRTTSLSWQPRGPWNVGGRTRAFAVDVNNPNNLVAGSTSGGMWRSTDQGLTWTPTNAPTVYNGVTGVAQDTRAGHTNVWYYCTGEGDGASASATGAYYLGDGIYKSTDSGVTWTALPSTVTASLTTFDIWTDVVWNIITNPADMVNDVVFAAAYGGIYRSADGGTTWTMVIGSAGSSVSYYTDAAITSTGVLYVTLSSDGSQKGIYRSTDGVTFTNITPAGFPATFNRVKIGISAADESQVYFVANTPGTGTADTNYLGTVEWNSLWKYKYLSGDGSGSGGVWNNYSANIPNTGGFFDKFTSQGSYNLVVAVKPDDSNTVFLGGSGLYRSTSGFADNTHTSIIGGYAQGASLPVVNEYLDHHPDQHQLVFQPGNPAKMFSSNDGGVFVTNNDTAATVAWTSLDNGYLTSMFYTCGIDHATTSDIIIGGAQDNGSWYTNSATLTSPWVTPRGGDGSYCAIADSGKNFYFSLQQGKMWRTKLSASGVVDSSARIDPIGGQGYLFVNPFIIDPNDNDIMYLAAGRCIWRNNDLSGIPLVNNWDTISTNWVKFTDSLPGGSSLQVTALAASTVPANRLYYGSSSRRLYRVDNANVGLPSATDITGYTQFPIGGNIGCIAVDPTNADNILVVFTNYGVYSLFYSANGGATYKKVAGNLEATPSGVGDGPSLRWASIVPVSDGYVYLVGTSVGLFATTYLDTLADSTVWVQQGTSTIGAAVVDMIDYRSTDGLVVAATHSSGMYSTHITQVADVNSVKNISASPFGLNFSNFPNPFTNSTTIEFTLHEKSYINLKVYNEQGRLVSTLANGFADAGNQKYTFEPGLLSSGVYYCTLSTGTQSETRKLMLLR